MITGVVVDMVNEEGATRTLFHLPAPLPTGKTGRTGNDSGKNLDPKRENAYCGVVIASNAQRTIHDARMFSASKARRPHASVPYVSDTLCRLCRCLSRLRWPAGSEFLVRETN